MSNLLSGLKCGERLGAGAFGVVFLGNDPTHGDVAVKVLTRKEEWDDATWDTWKKGFLAEAQHLSRATHPHVVKVHYIAESADGQSVSICMQLCVGGSLHSRYEAGPLAIDEVRKIATDVLLGLQCLHARNMLHRDIKPANILVDARGNALISDFGFVSDNLVLGYASVAGYTDHIAHEVWMGRGTSIKSDIWALGATMYRLLHGKRWYDELPPPRDLIDHGGFADQLPWLPHVPKRWQRVIRQMMEDDNSKRYQSAEAALSAIASLPVTPIWQASVSPEKVRWQREKGGRMQVAEWTRTVRNHSWSAWSEPKAGTKGHRKSLGSSNGAVSKKTARAELEAFLA